MVAGACHGPTQLLVVVDSDLGDELEVVSVHASADASGSAQDFEISSTGLPFSFGIAPTSEQLREVSVSVTGQSRGSVITSYRAITRFVPGRTVVLEVPLARACVTEPSCDSLGQRCFFGECLELNIDPDTLPDSVDEPLASLFGAPTDLPDAGPGALPDACVAERSCVDPRNPCMRGLTLCEPAGERCELTVTLPEGVPCGEGRVCDGAGTCQ